MPVAASAVGEFGPLSFWPSLPGRRAAERPTHGPSRRGGAVASASALTARAHKRISRDTPPRRGPRRSGRRHAGHTPSAPRVQRAGPACGHPPRAGTRRARSRCWARGRRRAHSIKRLQISRRASRDSRSTTSSLGPRPDSGAGDTVVGHRRLARRFALCARGGTAVGGRLGRTGCYRGQRPRARRRFGGPSGALAVSGRTVAVLGSGVDIVYPPEHAALAAAITTDGARVRELVTGTPPRAEHFPARNRIISGLSLAILVIEASERSGSLITFRCGLEQGREVMAVPGRILAGRNRGAHALLRDGAKVVESVDDILEEIRLMTGSPVRCGTSPNSTSDDPLLAQMMTGESHDLAALVALCGFDGATLLPRLLGLELKGLVVRAGGGRFVRSSGRW